MEALLMAMATGYDYRKYQKVKANERLKAWAAPTSQLRRSRGPPHRILMSPCC